MYTANDVLKSPLKFKLVHVCGGGDQEWAAVELEALDAVAKNGESYLEDAEPMRTISLMAFVKACSIRNITVG